MPEVIFNGADGRLEGRYHHARGPNAPLALILHPHPLHGGTMNNKVVFDVFHIFARRGFSVLRFNFRGVGRSARASYAMPPPHSTGCSSTTATAAPAGSPASRSAPGSACSF
jgi:pimeloyl-ACP methyl ester carboxylesterase